jgi:hypothetical protein
MLLHSFIKPFPGRMSVRQSVDPITRHIALTALTIVSQRF